MPTPIAVLCGAMFVSGVSIEVFGVSWTTAPRQGIPEEKLSRVSAYDWFGSVSMVPLATASAGPAESAFGRSATLWGCAPLCTAATAAMLCVRNVRNLPRRSVKDAPIAFAGAGSADAEGPVRRIG